MICTYICRYILMHIYFPILICFIHVHAMSINFKVSVDCPGDNSGTSVIQASVRAKVPQTIVCCMLHPRMRPRTLAHLSWLRWRPRPGAHSAHWRTCRGSDGGLDLVRTARAGAPVVAPMEALTWCAQRALAHLSWLQMKTLTWCADARMAGTSRDRRHA